jgi:SNF2 family DNA or RNA helicase
VYVLHALFSEAGSWELWAEDSDPRPARPRAARRGPTRHPFVLEPARLIDVLSAAGDDVAAAVRKADPHGGVSLALPSTGSMPAPSALLAKFGPPPGRRPGAVLRPWSVPTLVFDPSVATVLLDALAGALGANALRGGATGAEVLTVFDSDGRETGVPLADSVRYALALARFAETLVRTGDVLPSLNADYDVDDDEADPPADPDYRANWQASYTLDSAVRRRALIEAMPPVFRAEMVDGSPSDQAQGRPAADVFDEAVNSLVDAYVIDALTGPQGLHGREPAAPDLAAAPSEQTAAQAWLSALSSPSGNQLEPGLALAEHAEPLAEKLERWQAGPPTPSGSVRTCFRLVPPADGPDLDLGPAAGAATTADTIAGTDTDGPWVVELLLQSAQDPSLLATAREVWRRSGAARVMRATGSEPRQDLLAGLGRAVRVFPQLAAALKQPEPVAVELDTEAAHEFLSRTAPALVAHGFGVLLPAWWTGASTQLSLGLAVPNASDASDADDQTTSRQDRDQDRGPHFVGFGLDALVDYEWRLSLGGDQLTEAEFLALAEAKGSLVRVRGRWVEIDRDRLAAVVQALSSVRGTAAEGGHRGRMRAGDLLHTAVFGLPGPTREQAFPVDRVEAGGWLGDLLSGVAEQRCEPLAPPPGLHATLRPYQERGLGWLAFMHRLGLGAVLADSMGLGKTIQVLALLEAERDAEATDTAPDTPAPDTPAPPTLLICPMSLVANWQREAAKFTPGLTVHVHHGAERLTGEEFRAAVSGAHLVITTYGLALRDQAELAAVGWRRIVIDEAQAIKNAGTKQARAVRSLPAAHRIALTGTPVENRLSDLWSIMEFANPGLLGSAESFKTRFARPIERDGDAAAAARLRRATGAFVLRREKNDPAIISDLPDKIEMTVTCSLTSEQASLYQAVVDDSLVRIGAAEGLNRRGLVLALLTRLKQICNHPAHYLQDNSALPGRSGKLALVEEICEEVLDAGEKALLFTQYAEFGGMLQQHLAARFGREVAFLHGGVPKKARDALVLRFEQPAGPPLFVLSLKAGGVGLNLTAASHVVHVDRWWNPAVENQATDRAFRIGQTKNVQVRKLVCAGTLEERIDQVIERKRELAEQIVGTGEKILTELSTAELREVVRLAAGSVVE